MTISELKALITLVDSYRNREQRRRAAEVIRAYQAAQGEK